ncbi:hypothetical protein AS9A_3677 [Hoyosella subflava DQS3-9A1]|uniref:Uncharacterized protein n=1 Tax=Hoyosella subflava (strain DSM 45089 / JCM 17490 / NBRC 109087 / DQS3-9A1) TaxID=443218 RepID=F6EEX8_HOYSD|nr:hypothetical protein AS9A_3677 [Hoyosella subflava DQS3-9A1]
MLGSHAHLAATTGRCSRWLSLFGGQVAPLRGAQVNQISFCVGAPMGAAGTG